MFYTLLGWTGLLMTISKPAFVWLTIGIIRMSRVWGSAAIVFLIAFDVLDGVLFRASPLAAYKKLARVRRWVDVIGDRLGIQWVALTLVVIYNFPFTFYAAITAREIVLICIVTYSFATRRPLQEPNNPSRAAATMDGATGISWMLLGWTTAVYCLVLMTVFAVISFYKYFRTIAETPKK